MVDTADAQKSISKTSDEAEGLGNKLANGVKTAGKWAAGVAGAAIAVGGAMVSAAKDTAAEMDVIDKGSQRMKISAESYQELAHAASLSGVEMSNLEKAAKKLEGTGMNLDDALNEIYSLQTAEERAAKAAELFGENVAYQMTPMLNASAEEMAAMRQEAHDLGLVMGEDAVKRYHGSAVLKDCSAEQLDGQAEEVGSRISRRFLSNWTTESFSFYYFDDFSSESWFTPLQDAADGQFAKAIQGWEPLVKDGTNLKRACACFNMAQAFYLLGDYVISSRWLDEADKLENLTQVPALRKRLASHLEK